MKTNRRNWIKKMSLLITGISFAKYNLFANTNSELPNNNSLPFNQKPNNIGNMQLGAFSMSLNVKDIQASKIFYENLGFTVFGGDIKSNYLIMKNGNALIGIFQGMFEGNILTFNPGWDENAKDVKDFTDIRDIQKQLKSKGVALISEADESTSGPASIVLMDPDGNQILIDQHR
ncbi:MAG TPA: VOC family protein [Chitinophagales bacterium]|nr:VOC family protein [Chitinophagales bacterium]